MPDGSNVFEIKPAVRENTAAFIALAGPSGSGKTRSALELATGLAGDGKILVADTEGKRSLHYADMYNFDRVGWTPPFTPEANAALIDLAEKNGYAVLVIDSQSDEYEGEGGLQEIRDTTRDEFWAKTKARHKAKLINRMRRAKVHIIFCLRAEERVRISKVDGRTVVEQLGWQPICEKRFLYEVQSSFLFDPQRPGLPQPIKLYDIHARFFPADKPVSRAAGEALAKWCAGGIEAAPEQPTIEDRAREAAEKGKAALTAFWRGLTKEQRRPVAHLIAIGDEPGELAKRAAEVDAAAATSEEPPDDIPFTTSEPPAGAHDEREGTLSGGPPAGEPTLADTIAAELAAAATEADVTAIEVRHKRALNDAPHPEWLALRERIDARRAELAAAPAVEPQPSMAV